jgi:hypothetical protein
MVLAALVAWGGVRLATAQDVNQGANDKPKQYVVQYVLVSLLVALGVMIVCRPSNRLDEPPFQKE